jgi:uncharacterized membrane protein
LEFAVLTLFLGLVIFLGTHSIGIVAPAWRDRVKSVWGPNRWRTLYSILSAIGFVLLLYGFAQARQHPIIWYAPSHLLRSVARILMVPVLPLVLAAYLPGRIQRAAKHPLLAAVKLWAFAHLLANGTAADVVLFGSFLIWAVADRIALKRHPKPMGSTLPVSKWNDFIAVAAGLLLYVWMLEWLHLHLLGVSPLG